MQKIKFENIKLYKADIVYVLMEMRFVYASHQKHTQVLECDKLIQILNNGEDEFTKVYPSMVEKVIIRIPVLENGNLDLKTQKEISKKYLIIEQIKTFIQEELMKIEKLVISF